MNFNQQLETLLKTLDKFNDKEGVLLKQNIKHSSEKFDSDLIKLLLNDKDTKAHFFDEIDSATIFNYRKFIDYIDDKNFLIDSYTKFSNKVGLTISNKHIQQINDVVLSFPFKDCVLEGGQSKDDEKRKEIFFNEVLAKDEINRLLDKKVITNAKKYTQDGVSDKVDFKRDENGLIKDNLIIKGNNLLALHTLKSNFAGKVKLIYIDPPYNTGNDSFNYNDNFNHSTWLTFMKNRLEAARDLLSDDGVIFVQCDDNEQAYLKVLMDEVFGRDNFVNVISAKMKNIAGASGGGEDKRLKKNIEFLNIFAKNYINSKLESAYEYTEIWKLVEFYKLEKISWKYTSVIIDPGKKEYLKSTKDGDGNEIKIYKRIYPVFKSISQLAKEQKKTEKEIYYSYIEKIFTTAMPQSSIRTRVLSSIKNMQCNFISIEYVPRSGKNKGKIYEQFYKGDKLRLLTWLKDVVEKKENKYYKKDLQGTFWDGFNLNNLSKEGDTVFESGKKPEELVKKVLEIATNKGDLVLDYHLGSGTTCAVAHKMGRQYIGIEQMDYIEDIAVKRMQKVIEGEQGGISKAVEWQGGGEFIYFELDKYNQKYIDNLNAIKAGHASSKTIEQLYDEIAEQAFLNYDVESKKLLTHKADFKSLSLSEQQEFLISILNKNQLYKNLSEIDDQDLAVDENTKSLNESFYGDNQ